MSSRYTDRRGLRRYLAGAAAARAGDEMSGPALLLLGFAVTGRPETGSGLLASLTIAGAAGGPLFGALLDRSRRPDRLLAGTLAAYALGIVAVQAAVGRLPMPALAAIALLAGLFNPAVAGGWTAQLPRVVTGRELDRGSALDALTFSAASLAGPALAAGMAAGIGARAAVLTAAGLVALAVPSACSLSRYRPAAATGAGQGPTTVHPTLRPADGRGVRGHRGPAPAAAGHRDLGGVLRRDRHAPGLLPAARRAAARRRGPRRAADQRDRGRLADRQRDPGPPPAPQALRPLRRGRPDTRVLASTLVIGASMAAAALAPGWLTLAAVALGGAGEGPQLTALLAVRHRETPAHLRGQVYTTAASLKIAGLAAGAALAGPLAGWSVTGCLLIAAGTQLVAAAAYLLAGPTRQGRREPTGRNGEPARTPRRGGGPAAAPPGTAGTGAGADRPVRSG